jgi:hypothetical protein
MVEDPLRVVNDASNVDDIRLDGRVDSNAEV